MQNYWNELMYW